ncbi:hypothetical protein GGH95_002974, partial [Coemansia sp. RSA 1836]
IPDDLDEDDEPEPCNAIGLHALTADQGEQSGSLPVAVAPVLGAKDGDTTSLEDAFVTGIYPTDAPSTAVVADYLDILDFIDTKDHSDVGVSAQADEDDGHISSDLLANSDSSDIDLSGDDGANSSSSDSDDQYLSKISQQRMFRVANVVDINQHAGQAAEHSSVTQVQPTTTAPIAAVPDAVEYSAVGLSSRSTLLRSRRILTKGKSIRRGSASQRSTREQPVVSTQPTEASLNVSIPEANRPLGEAVPSPRWSVADVEKQTLASQRQSAPSAYSAAHSAIARTRAAAPSTRPDSLFSAGRGNTPVAPAPMAVGPASPGSPGLASGLALGLAPGLAKLAEAAQAAAQVAGTRTTRGLSVSAIGGARHKPLPPVPDRISRTLQAADAAEAQMAIANGAAATARPGRGPPPLPAKARPKIPQALGGDRLSSRAAVAAALERPSSQALFGTSVARAASQQLLPEHMAPAGMHRSATESRVGASPLGLQAWLQRTDMLASASSAATSQSSPPSELIPESLSMPTEMPAGQLQQLHTPRPMTATRKKAKSRVIRKVAVLPLSSQEPPPLRPASTNSSIHSSASHDDGPSPPTSPVLAPNSQAVAVSAALALEEHSHMATASTTTTALSDPHRSQSPLLQGAYPLPHEYEYDSMPTMAGPTVLSAPPGTIEDYPPGAPGIELLEPSAPMLLEPTAPELPEQWSMVSPNSYAFPQPMYYQSPVVPPQYAYGAVPGMAPGHVPMGFVMPMMMPPQRQMYSVPVQQLPPLPLLPPPPQQQPA